MLKSIPNQTKTARKKRMGMDYRKKFIVKSGSKIQLDSIDPGFTGKHKSHKDAKREMRQHVWKISESNYSERKLWPRYVEAYEEAIRLTSTKHAPWYIISADHKWFRNLAILQIVADTVDEMRLKLPSTHVDIDDICSKYHAAENAQKTGSLGKSKQDHDDGRRDR